jgi:hypothetical protein
VNIYEFVWPRDRIEHIARHNVEPEEVEEVCFSRSLVRRIKNLGENPAYQVFGRTKEGRYLLCIVIQFPDGRGYPVTARPIDREGKAQLSAMGKTMSKSKIPSTDSVEDLARFWDTHDATDFEDEVEEVKEQVFVRKPGTMMTFCLEPKEAEAVEKIAKAKGVEEATLLREWVLEKIQGS